MVVELPADVAAAAGLVHAEVVDVQTFDVGEDVVVEVLLEDAEGVAQDAAVVVDEDGAAVVVDEGAQLLVGVFGGAGRFEEVRPPLVMDGVHLNQQPVNVRHIGLHGPANFHRCPTPFVG